MAPKRPNSSDVLSATVTQYMHFTYYLHTAFSAAKMDGLVWTADGKGKLLTYCDADNIIQPVVFIVFARIENNDNSCRIAADGKWPGVFDFPGLKLSCVLIRPLPGDSVPNFDLPATWPIALGTLRAIMNKQKEASAPALPGASFMISHKLFRVKKDLPVNDEEEEEEEEEDNDALIPSLAAPRPEDNLYRPIDPALDKTLRRADYPMPKGSKAEAELAKLPQNIAIEPLPAYDAGTGDVILPEDYVKFQGALVCAHFDMRHIFIGREKKDVFTFGIKRLEYISPGTAIGASPSKTKRARFRKPDHTAPDLAAAPPGSQVGGSQAGVVV
ncbi:hypothetical protein AURDEDRAFT_180357 [Auricularia subglabra TFB-10046 SS5]|nr:hypothetical protein AURDEDRAFT_180357 [Auricularia subglabra TFB-10046 SS5]